MINGSLYPLAAGDAVSFNVLTGLLYSDGAAMLTTPANDPEFTIDSGFSRVVTSTSGPQTGFVFATADSDGGIHKHIDFLLTPGSSAGVAPPGGVRCVAETRGRRL
ncbi:MAG: hypothetical protein R3C10_18585 [Pirellulales bacterium]